MSEQPPTNWRKWTLFVLTIVLGILQIVILALGAKSIKDSSKSWEKYDSKVTDKEWEDIKDKSVELITGSLIAGGVIAGLVQALFLFGIYKEIYCLTLTYAIMSTLATIGSLFAAIGYPSFWGNFIITLIITILAYLFARDIKRNRPLLNEPAVIMYANYPANMQTFPPPNYPANVQTYPSPNYPADYPGTNPEINPAINPGYNPAFNPGFDPGTSQMNQMNYPAIKPATSPVNPISNFPTIYTK